LQFKASPGEIVCKTLSRKTLLKKRFGGVAQGVSPEFKPQYCKKKKKNCFLSWKETVKKIKKKNHSSTKPLNFLGVNLTREAHAKIHRTLFRKP
jgi:glutamine amidotransferase-like uncharacterized protein